MHTKTDLKSTKPLILLDGKKISEDKMKRINPDKVQNIKVLPEEEAKKLGSNAGQYGMIVSESKKTDK